MLTLIPRRYRMGAKRGTPERRHQGGISPRHHSWLGVPVRVRRPESAGKALSFSPLVQTCRANSTCVKRVPHVSAGTRPEVFFSGRPAAQRATDARAGWLAISLNL